jgi:hypothetical protein
LGWAGQDWTAEQPECFGNVRRLDRRDFGLEIIVERISGSCCCGGSVTT